LATVISPAGVKFPSSSLTLCVHGWARRLATIHFKLTSLILWFNNQLFITATVSIKNYCINFFLFTRDSNKLTY